MKNYDKEIQKISVSVKWEIQSESWFHEWYEVYLAYRDKWTWKFELISRSKLETNWHWWVFWYEVWNYEVFWENITIYWWWKDVVLVFNWKYRKLKFKEEEVIWWTIFHEEDFIDFIPKDKTNFMEDNYIENSTSEANDIFFDEFIQNYILEERFNRNINESWVSDQEYQEYVDKYWSEAWINITLTRQKKLESMLAEWKSTKEVFNKVFDEMKLQEDFESQWYSKEDIAFLRDNWMNKSYHIIEKYSVPERIQKINDKIILNKEMINERNNQEKKEIEDSNKIIDNTDRWSIIIKTEEIKNKDVWKKDETFVKENQYMFLFAIWFLLFFLAFLLMYIRKKINKKKS